MMIDQYSVMSALISQSSSVRDQLAQTEAQVSSGLISTSYSGLGSGARTSLDLSPQIAHQATWSANIDAANGPLQVTQGSLTAIQGIASQFFAQVNTLDPSKPDSITDLSVSAQAALTQVASYLNAKSGHSYVFAGTDSSNPPVTTTDWSTLATDLLASDAPSSPPFSSTIGTAAPKVQTGDTQWTSVGLIANQNTFGAPVAPTTGSSMRDVMRSLASLATMTPANAASVAADARDRLNGAITAISAEAGGIGAVQNSLKQQQTYLSAFSTTLQTQVGSVQDVYAETAITKISTLQTQLQASYQIISQAQTMSLAKFL